MATTLDTSPEMEALLRLAAAKNEQTVTDYLLTLVQGDLKVDLSEYAGLQEYAASVAGVQAGVEDMEAGGVPKLNRQQNRRHERASSEMLS